jgi:hypothetical protein
MTPFEKALERILSKINLAESDRAELRIFLLESIHREHPNQLKTGEMLLPAAYLGHRSLDFKRKHDLKIRRTAELSPAVENSVAYNSSEFADADFQLFIGSALNQTEQKIALALVQGHTKQAARKAVGLSIRHFNNHLVSMQRKLSIAGIG